MGLNSGFKGLMAFTHLKKNASVFVRNWIRRHNCGILLCDAVYSGRVVPAFRRDLLPISSEYTYQNPSLTHISVRITDGINGFII